MTTIDYIIYIMNVNGWFVVQPSGVCDILHDLTLSCGTMTGRACSKELHARLSVGVLTILTIVI